MIVQTVACVHCADACVHAVFSRLLRRLVSKRAAIDGSSHTRTFVHVVVKGIIGVEFSL